MPRGGVSEEDIFSFSCSGLIQLKQGFLWHSYWLCLGGGCSADLGEVAAAGEGDFAVGCVDDATGDGEVPGLVAGEEGWADLVAFGLFLGGVHAAAE